MTFTIYVCMQNFDEIQWNGLKLTYFRACFLQKKDIYLKYPLETFCRPITKKHVFWKPIIVMFRFLKPMKIWVIIFQEWISYSLVCKKVPSGWVPTPSRLILATAVDYLILFILGIEGTGKSQMESFKLINGLLLQCTDDWGFWWIKLKLCRAYFLGFVEPFEFKHPTQVKILLCLDMKLKCLKWVSFSRYSIQL